MLNFLRPAASGEGAPEFSSHGHEDYEHEDKNTDDEVDGLARMYLSLQYHCPSEQDRVTCAPPFSALTAVWDIVLAWGAAHEISFIKLAMPLSSSSGTETARPPSN